VTAANGGTRHYSGLTAAHGAAAGLLYQADAAVTGPAATAEQVQAAFASVAADRQALAGRLRADGRPGDADIVTVAALIAADPVLAGAAVAAVRAGADAATAVRESAARQSAALAALPDPDLADRATDVRQVAAAVLEHLAGGPQARPDGEFILLRRDVAAADLIELAEAGLVGAASVAGGASSHAAIIARGLGIPMITGIGEAALGEPTGSRAILDAGAGWLAVEPPDERWQAARTSRSSTVNATPAASLDPAGRCITADGQNVLILCNAASAAETRRGLAAGAGGVGLLRTEIPFTQSPGWPDEDEHLAQLTPVLALLAGRPATVRLLDFSGDKVPPFLRDAAAQADRGADRAQAAPAASAGGPAGAAAGLAALLGHPAALLQQLSAVLTAGRDALLTILIPMVSDLAEVARVREVLGETAADLGVATPALGIMVERAGTAAAAERFADEVDFFSIGTNDLTGDVLCLDRLSLSARPGLAADPRVLALIEHVVAAAAAAGIPVSVCGDAAADPVVAPLLIGLGIRAVSVPAAQVGVVADRISGLAADACTALAAKAVRAQALDEVEELVRLAMAS
jgi:phosphoenolpyruvate-protein kinase (PTS system EI component)